MRKILLLTLSVLCLALQPMSAQKKNEGTGEYKYRKAVQQFYRYRDIDYKPVEFE